MAFKKNPNTISLSKTVNLSPFKLAAKVVIPPAALYSDGSDKIVDLSTKGHAFDPVSVMHFVPAPAQSETLWLKSDFTATKKTHQDIFTKEYCNVFGETIKETYTLDKYGKATEYNPYHDDDIVVMAFPVDVTGKLSYEVHHTPSGVSEKFYVSSITAPYDKLAIKKQVTEIAIKLKKQWQESKVDYHKCDKCGETKPNYFKSGWCKECAEAIGWKPCKSCQLAVTSADDGYCLSCWSKLKKCNGCQKIMATIDGSGLCYDCKPKKEAETVHCWKCNQLKPAPVPKTASWCTECLAEGGYVVCSCGKEWKQKSKEHCWKCKEKYVPMPVPACKDCGATDSTYYAGKFGYCTACLPKHHAVQGTCFHCKEKITGNPQAYFHQTCYQEVTDKQGYVEGYNWCITCGTYKTQHQSKICCYCAQGDPMATGVYAVPENISVSLNTSKPKPPKQGKCLWCNHSMNGQTGMYHQSCYNLLVSAKGATKKEIPCIIKGCGALTTHPTMMCTKCATSYLPEGKSLAITPVESEPEKAPEPPFMLKQGIRFHISLKGENTLCGVPMGDSKPLSGNDIATVKASFEKFVCPTCKDGLAHF